MKRQALIFGAMVLGMSFVAVPGSAGDPINDCGVVPTPTLDYAHCKYNAVGNYVFETAEKDPPVDEIIAFVNRQVAVAMCMYNEKPPAEWTLCL